MKLIKLEFIEESNTDYIFKIVMRRTFFGKIKDVEFDCFRNKIGASSRFINTGNYLCYKWSCVDASINAILNTKNKSYNCL